jgi:hypothetical protein
MKRKLAGMLCGCAAVVAVAATPAVATPNPNPDSTPASCHGYDVSSFAHEFGGTEAVADGAGGPGFTVQSAQKADHSFCKTGVLPPPPA